MTRVDSNLRTEQLANPFRSGKGVAPPYLAGGDRVLDGFEAFVAARPLHANWSLTGLRGTGIVRRLVDRGLVYRASCGTYDFALPLVGAYIRLRKPNLSDVSRSERTTHAGARVGR